ncbi:MAG: hypothetical protein HYX69_09125 [Planctomycetia bacterium]|nr:hypothetical protein [Planctomycetia bacterium]
MKSRTTRRFRERFAKLPDRIKSQARDAYRLFAQNPAHPGLRFKQVLSNPPTYSARVGIGHPAVGSLEGDMIIWFWIGTHAEYDKLLHQL